jgi:hypothetical protein
MADPQMYKKIGNGPGLVSLPLDIQSRLIGRGIPADAVREMIGGNIARRLAGID